MSLINVIFTNILSMSTIASIVFIITLAFRKILQNKITSSKQCLLWIVFVCTLIFPINFSSRLSIKNLCYESPKENVIIDFSKTYKAEKEETNLNENQYAKYVSCTWFATSIVLIIYDVLLYSNMLGKKSQNQVLKLEVFEDCKKELEIKKDIKLILQDKIKTPSLCGIFRTKILITKEVLDLDRQELKYIFIHELNHYKSNHHIIYIILNLIKRVYWFNPFIHYAIKILKEDLEYATDEKVLENLHNRKEYSKTILKILAINNGISYPVPNICGKKEELERRFEKMKNKKVDNKFGAVIIAFAVFSMSLITISLASERYNNSAVEDANTNATDEIIAPKEDDNELVYVKPLSGAKITSRFDKTRTNPVTGENLFHTGVDVVSDETDEIVATADGKVIFANYNGTRGNTVKIEHADGNTSVYSHGSKILVKDGDSVKAGDVIMTVGSTGMATGPHLHFEIINAQGEYIDVNQMFESK